jgi:hypothetical protein
MRKNRFFLKYLLIVSFLFYNDYLEHSLNKLNFYHIKQPLTVQKRTIRV